MHAVLETSIFSRRADALLSPAERADLIATLAANPTAGDLIPGLGGVRKLRFAAAGRGKSAAFRVPDHALPDDHPILTLPIYGKNEQANPTKDLHKAMVPLVEDLKAHAKAAHTMADENMPTKRTDVTDKLLASLREANNIVAGKRTPARVHLPPGEPDVRAIRKKVGLSQPAFAKRFGFALASVRDWEQGRRRPTLAARTLLRVIEYNPEMVLKALEAEQIAA